MKKGAKQYRLIYEAVEEASRTYHYPVSVLCEFGQVSRAGYYKWLREKDG